MEFVARRIVNFFLIFVSVLTWINGTNAQELVFEEDWAGGIGNWSVSNGLWEVGTPSVGPDSCLSPPNCAGTVLTGNYPHNSNTRLESPIVPAISLPSKSSKERIQLKFWQWFLNSNDGGLLQISVNGGEWKTISEQSFTGSSTVWTQYVADLSVYADSTIRIGFLFISGSSFNDNGWYIDDIRIEKDTVSFGRFTLDSLVVEDFESGVDSWSADNGLWEVGLPQVGPDSCLSPPNCTGTVLTGNYPHNKQTRFLTPSFFLNPRSGKVPVLFFWHWFRLSNDAGMVQISVDGGPWENIGTAFSGTSPSWTQAGGFDLSAYVNSRIRIGFLFASGSSFNDNGWYIDDLRIDGIEDPTSVQSNFTVPTDFTLSQNYPNPFNPTTTIEYSIANTTPVEIRIYNQLGQKVRTLLNEPLVQTGFYLVTWDGRDDNNMTLASGLYFYQIKTLNFVSVKMAVLLK